MVEPMHRGKQQVLLSYLPGKTFDYEKIGTIARVSKIRSMPNASINPHLVLRTIEDQIHAWDESHRTIFRNLERGIERFIFVEPREVESEMFPLVFWCENPQCGIVTESRGSMPSRNCSSCRAGRLIQLRFVKIHRCGAIDPLRPFPCNHCRSPRRKIALETRGSERIANFQWVCRECSNAMPVIGGPCRSCSWPQPNRNMSIEVHRAGRTYYPHYAVLLNQPSSELNNILAQDSWPILAASSFFRLPELEGRTLLEIGGALSSRSENGLSVLSATDRDRLRARGISEDQINQFEKMQAQLRVTRENDAFSNFSVLSEILIRKSGVPAAIWQNAGQEMLEAVIPRETGNIQELNPSTQEPLDIALRQIVSRLGLTEVTLISDFPITTATFGFSRMDYVPNNCNINPFPGDPDHGGKFPIFVDIVQADAILIRLDHNSVLDWLRINGVNPQLPNGEDPQISARAYFIRLFNDVYLRNNLNSTQQEARLVFGLLHTMSHIFLKKAALLCGLDATSLSEYLLPKALSFAIYCNHRFGATIGALTSLFEQSIFDWFSDIYSSRKCVYDPVCIERSGDCHACTHLGETSCRYFNLNLGRPFLFGGNDRELGHVHTGYFDKVTLAHA